MVPQAALNAWAQHAPWQDELDIEQDLILSRSIIEIANHPLLGDALAFRGGTSLHKLHVDQPWRSSNDLDYVRTNHGPLKEIMAAVRETMHDIDLLLRQPPAGYTPEAAAAAVRDHLLRKLG